MSRTLYTGCLKKFAIIRRTDKVRFLDTYLMCRVLAHIYLLTFSFYSVEFSFLSCKKPITHVMKVVKGKTVDVYCFIIISKCYDFNVLLCSEYHQK